MANDIRNWVKKKTVGDRNAKVVLLEIADCGNDEGFCTYGIAAIAATLEMSLRTVERGIAYLEQMKFIEREECKKNAGKFTSKNTRILIPEADWKKITSEREKRRLRNLPEPPVNLSPGNFSPADKLTATDGKPPDKLTDGGNNRPSICQKPPVILTVGQNDGLNVCNKEYSTLEETEEEKKEESLSPRTPAREGNPPDKNPAEKKPEAFDDLPEAERFGDRRRQGIPVHTMLGIEHDPKFIAYTNTIIEGLKIRHGTKARLPNSDLWEAKIETAWHNEFSAEQCLEVFDLLKKIYAKKKLPYPITPANWENNIPRIEALRDELKDLQKGVKKPNGYKPKQSGGATKSDDLSDAEWRELNAHLLPDYGDE